MRKLSGFGERSGGGVRGVGQWVRGAFEGFAWAGGGGFGENWGGWRASPGYYKFMVCIAGKKKWCRHKNSSSSRRRRRKRKGQLQLTSTKWRHCGCCSAWVSSQSTARVEAKPSADASAFSSYRRRRCGEEEEEPATLACSRACLVVVVFAIVNGYLCGCCRCRCCCCCINDND